METKVETLTWEEKIAKDHRFYVMARWSGIPLTTWMTHRLFTYLPMEGSETAYKLAIEFASGNSKHHFITFVGEPGRGKTHLALGIGWHWLEQNQGIVKYSQTEALLGQLRFGFNARSREDIYNFDELMAKAKNLSLLVLDDLGVEQSTEWGRAKLDEIIDHRYLNRLATVVTTNVEPEKLEERLASRLREGNVVVLKCGDYRQILAKTRE